MLAKLRTRRLTPSPRETTVETLGETAESQEIHATAEVRSIETLGDGDVFIGGFF